MNRQLNVDKFIRLNPVRGFILRALEALPLPAKDRSKESIHSLRCFISNFNFRTSITILRIT